MNNLLDELSRFFGTEHYHVFNPLTRLMLTDGMKYLCDNAKCYWLADVVASVQEEPEIKANSSFILWQIKKKEDTATVKALTDREPEGKILYEQYFEYTDFPLMQFEFYQCENILLLKSEY